jgi:hypothetical protein
VLLVYQFHQDHILLQLVQEEQQLVCQCLQVNMEETVVIQLFQRYRQQVVELVEQKIRHL